MRERNGYHGTNRIRTLPDPGVKMPLEVIEISEKHKLLLDKLSELVPDLESDSPQSLQRIFGLGLIALTMQITNKARADDQSELVKELGNLAREMVEAEQW